MSADEILHQLDELLISLPDENEGMLISEFDGFCTGLIVCPDIVLPGEWIPIVWGDEVTAPFERAMRLRPDAWERIVESHDEEAAASVTMMLTLHEIAEGRCDLPDDSIDDLTQRAPDLIHGIVLNLNAWTKGQAGSGAGSAGLPFPLAANSTGEPFRGKKVGRNEPCQCGSGRKYKRCFGAN